MTCPKCKEKTNVIDSRSKESGKFRRRECINCGYRFNTLEVENENLSIIENIQILSKKWQLEKARMIGAIGLLWSEGKISLKQLREIIGITSIVDNIRDEKKERKCH